MKPALICLFALLLIPVSLWSMTYDNGDNSFSFNNIGISLQPDIQYAVYGPSVPFVFTHSVVQENGGYRIVYTNSKLDIIIKVTPYDETGIPAWKVEVSGDCKEYCKIMRIALNLNLPNSNIVTYFSGPDAISSHKQTDFKNLVPYTDRCMELDHGNDAVWVVGSNYNGCSGVEWLTSEKVYLYNYEFHYGHIFNDPNGSVLERFCYTRPLTVGHYEFGSFLLFEQKPVVVRFNRWQDNKRAAFCMTSDADCEDIPRLKAVFWGSSDPNSPKYMHEGLVPNHLKVTNTVFGSHINTLGNVWNDIKAAGNTIGYHTYTDSTDLTAATSHSLLEEMTDYNVRFWIDHCYTNNKEDFSYKGTVANSTNYILDVINQSNICYAWMALTPSTNPMNSFDDPWRLPHIMYEFTGLNKPVWFVGRMRAETWDYKDMFWQLDFEYNVTAENLDKLIIDRGLCMVYTHFCFPISTWKDSFYNILPSGVCEIRDDVEARFEMLDDYQNEHGLWIDTAEAILDRMLAMEKVKIASAQRLDNGKVLLTVNNESDANLNSVYFYYNDTEYHIDDFAANSNRQIYISDNLPPVETLHPQFLVTVNNRQLQIQDKSNTFVPALNLKLFNVKGQLVKTIHAPQTEDVLTVPVPELKTGIYFLHLQAPAVNSKGYSYKILLVK